MRKTIRRFLLYAAIAAFFLMICIRLFAGPVAKHYLSEWLVKQGAETAAIASITMNPFDLSIELLDLKLQKSGYPLIELKNAYLNFSMFGLLRKELRISKAGIQGIGLELHQKKAGFEIGGFPFPVDSDQSHEKKEEKPGPSEWKIRLIQGLISDCRIRIITPELNSRIVVDKMITWDTLLSKNMLDGAFKFSGELNDAQLLLDSRFKIHDRNGTASCKASLKNLQIGDFRKFLPETVSALTGKLSVTSKITADIHQEKIELSQKGKGGIALLKVDSEPVTASADTSEFQTDVLIILEEKRLNSARVNGSFASTGFQVQDKESGFTLVKWKESSAEKISVLFKETLDLRIPSIETAGLVVSSPPVKAEENPPLLLAEKLSVRNLSVQDMDTKVGSITIEDMECSVRIDDSKKIVNLPEVSTSESSEGKVPDEKTEKTDIPEEKESPGIQVGLFEIKGSSRFNYTDDSIDPVFKESLKINKIEIRNLDNKNPDQESPFLLSAGINEYGKLDLSGAIKPFASELYVNVDNKISDYPLPNVSAYSRDVMGYDIESGKLNKETRLEINGDRLSGKAFFKISGIKLTPHGADTAGKITRQVTMPLNVAVDLLSDEDGNFELEIPISGNLDDPDFSLSHFFQVALTNAARSAAYGAIRTAILPYGALVRYGGDAAVYEGEKLVKLRLEPVVYKAGKTLPEIQYDKYLEQLSALMKEQKDIRIILCGFAIPADMNTIDKRSAGSEKNERILLSLAEKRADDFKKILVEKHNVSPDRILDCPPEIDRDDGAKPRLEITL